MTPILIVQKLVPTPYEGTLRSALTCTDFGRYFDMPWVEKYEFWWKYAIMKATHLRWMLLKSGVLIIRDNTSFGSRSPCSSRHQRAQSHEIMSGFSKGLIPRIEMEKIVRICFLSSDGRDTSSSFFERTSAFDNQKFIRFSSQIVRSRIRNCSNFWLHAIANLLVLVFFVICIIICSHYYTANWGGMPSRPCPPTPFCFSVIRSHCRKLLAQCESA